MSKLRIVFFGTPDFAVESVDAINDAGYDIAAVVTMPDKPAGRGHKLVPSAVKQWALAHEKKVLQPVSLKNEEFLEELRSLNADLFVVIAFRMLPEVVWGMPPMGTFNLHASLLPDYRGAAPINWAIINGETKTGVTTFFLRHEIDTGDIIARSEVEIGSDEDAGSLHDRLMKLGAQVTLETLDAIAEGKVTPVKQDSIGASVKAAPKIFPATCVIDWNRPAAEIHNFVRGLSPYPAARALLQFPKTDKAEYKIFKVKPAEASEMLKPGEIMVDSGHILVGTSTCPVEILSLQAPGKKRLGARDFLNGLRQ